MFSHGERNTEQLDFLVSAWAVSLRDARRAEGVLFFWLMPFISAVASVVGGGTGKWGLAG